MLCSVGSSRSGEEGVLLVVDVGGGEGECCWEGRVGGSVLCWREIKISEWELSTVVLGVCYGPRVCGQPPRHPTARSGGGDGL